MTFVRTVLGDIDPADLGADVRPRAPRHRRRPAGRARIPDFRLDRRRQGGRRAGAGAGARPARRRRRDAVRRRPQRRASWPRSAGGAASTSSPRPGLHHERYYDDRPLERRVLDADEIAALLRAPTSTTGSTRTTTPGPVVRPDAAPGRRHQDRRQRGRLTRSRGAGRSRPPRPPTLRPACPILTHCDDGTAGARSRSASSPSGASRRPTSSCRTPTRSSTAATSARSSRPARSSSTTRASAGSRASTNGTLTLLGWMFEDGFGDRVVLGMDAARRGYWATLRRGAGHGVPARRRSPARWPSAASARPSRRDCSWRTRPARSPSPARRPERRIMSAHRRRDRTARAPHDRARHPDERRRLARPPVVARRRRGRRRPRRARPGRHPRDAGRRGRHGDPRPGGGRHRRRLRRRDAPGRLLHGRVLPPPDRAPGARAGSPARRGAATTSSIASRSSSRSPHPTGSASSRSSATPGRGRRGRSRSRSRGRSRSPAGWPPAGQVYPNRVAATEAFVPILAAEIAALVADGRHVHPGRRAVAGDPPRRPGRLRRRSSSRGRRRRAAPASGSRPTSASATTSAGRSPGGRTGPVLDQLAQVRGRASSCSSSPTARWPSSTCSPS